MFPDKTRSGHSGSSGFCYFLQYFDFRRREKQNVIEFNLILSRNMFFSIKVSTCALYYEHYIVSVNRCSLYHFVSFQEKSTLKILFI